MRLIDAERFDFVTFEQKEFDSKEAQAFCNGVEFILDMIEHAPTINAVPMDVMIKIRDEIDRTVKHVPFSDYDFGYYMAMSVIKKIIDQHMYEVSLTASWEDSSNGWTCSECLCDSPYDTPFCPHCGRRMENGYNRH